MAPRSKRFSTSDGWRELGHVAKIESKVGSAQWSQVADRPQGHAHACVPTHNQPCGDAKKQPGQRTMKNPKDATTPTSNGPPVTVPSGIEVQSRSRLLRATVHPSTPMFGWVGRATWSEPEQGRVRLHWISPLPSPRNATRAQVTAKQHPAAGHVHSVRHAVQRQPMLGSEVFKGSSALSRAPVQRRILRAHYLQLGDDARVRPIVVTVSTCGCGLCSPSQCRPESVAEASASHRHGLALPLTGWHEAPPRRAMTHCQSQRTGPCARHDRCSLCVSVLTRTAEQGPRCYCPWWPTKHRRGALLLPAMTHVRGVRRRSMPVLLMAPTGPTARHTATTRVLHTTAECYRVSRASCCWVCAPLSQLRRACVLALVS